MVSLKKIFVLVAAFEVYATTAEALSTPQNASAYVFNTAKSLLKKALAPTPAPRNSPQPLKLIDMIPALAEDRKIKPCQKGNLGSGNSKTWSNYHEICSYRFDRSASGEDADRNVVIQRLNDAITRNLQPQPGEESPGKFAIRSPFVPAHVEFEEGKPENTTEWTTNPGTKGVDMKNACQLCTSINDNYVVPRGYISNDGGHQCVCKKWAKGNEKFMVCNCDLCDAFLISMGLRKICMDLLKHKIESKMLSGYAALDDYNIFIVQYNDWKGLGKAMDFAIADIQKDHSVCKSGVQGQKLEDRHRLLHEVALPGKVCPKLLEDFIKKDYIKSQEEYLIGLRNPPN
ncbi:hypothetical protein N431DRAFT_451756 [Stipitochalara longipes BDJ]|nr:hypothetical protein N431DRAFT_451756 [Stipitochalara longipes BDJ]